MPTDSDPGQTKQLDLLGKVQCAMALNLCCQFFEGQDKHLSLEMGEPLGDELLTIGVKTIHVKTERYATHLQVDTSKVHADFYVLVSYDEDRGASKIMGWISARDLMQAPIKAISGIKHYVMPCENLFPIDGLRSEGYSN